MATVRAMPAITRPLVSRKTCCCNPLPTAIHPGRLRLVIPGMHHRQLPGQVGDVLPKHRSRTGTTGARPAGKAASPQPDNHGYLGSFQRRAPQRGQMVLFWRRPVPYHCQPGPTASPSIATTALPVPICLLVGSTAKVIPNRAQNWDYEAESMQTRLRQVGKESAFRASMPKRRLDDDHSPSQGLLEGGHAEYVPNCLRQKRSR
jgi:hypothetical protein